MKKLAKFISMLAVAAMLFTLSGVDTLTVSAEEPLTYAIAYNSDYGEWRWQRGASEFNFSQSDESLDNLDVYVNDGDTIVVWGGNGEPSGVEFNVSARLSNVTLLNISTIALVGAGGIDEFYALSDSTAAVNSDVANAYVYDSSVVTFNNNVTNLEIICPPDEFSSVTSSAGTVGHVKRHYDGGVMYEVYNVAAGKFVSSNADLLTDPQYYSTTPSSSPSAGQTTASGSASANQNTASGSSADDYDDVPKTGESGLIFLPFGLSAICFLGSRKLERA